MTEQKIIHGSLDEIVEAVSKVCAQCLIHSHRQVSDENIRTALEKFVVCEEHGTKPIQSGILTGVCPKCTMKGGDDEA